MGLLTIDQRKLVQLACNALCEICSYKSKECSEQVYRNDCSEVISFKAALKQKYLGTKYR